MAEINSGDVVMVDVETAPGAFSGENLISFDTLDGPVSGFIRSDRVRTEKGRTTIEALVLDVQEERVAVHLQGSFFTTTGLVHLAKRRALKVT